jgi:hypothetical protein
VQLYAAGAASAVPAVNAATEIIAAKPANNAIVRLFAVKLIFFTPVSTRPRVDLLLATIGVKLTK